MIKFTYEGTQYEVGFNRRTAEMLQRQGFKKDEIENQSLIMIPMLVRASFAMNHKHIKISKIDEIYGNLANQDDFVNELMKSYLLAQSTLFGGDRETNGDNADFIQWSSD